MYNTNFRLDLDDIALIEAALQKQLDSLSKRRINLEEGDTALNESLHRKIKSINDLLGKIHNQKNWYRPNSGYVSG